MEYLGHQDVGCATKSSLVSPGGEGKNESSDVIPFVRPGDLRPCNEDSALGRIPLLTVFEKRPSVP